MKRIVASAGLVAVGAAGLNAANVGDLPAEQASRRWTASAALRGFYDDNYATRSDGPDKRGSGGIQFSPTVGFSIVPSDRTFFSASVAYSLLYYFDRPSSDIDQNVSLDLKLDHKFSERHRLRIEDIFTYSKE